ncbi:MAG: hydrolase [Gammaproteobacteria bacterium]|nr:MAG: hydrolase [Gammaproteobacteria bacterium]
MAGGILLDLDGVFYEGERPIPGAAETARWLHERGIPHLFLTNTTSRDRAALVAKLAALGIETGPDRILTPPVAAADWLRRHVEGPVALFVPEGCRGEFAGLKLWRGSGPAGAVVIGDLGEAWDYATLNTAFRLLMAPNHPPLVALGMTRYWKAPDGLRLDVAPFVVALQHASGVEPVVLGKPAEGFYRAALARLGAAPEEAVMVGDDIRSDIEGAQRLGIAGVLVRTGKFREADLSGGLRPAAVLDSVADLPRWWQATRGA